MSGRGRRKGDGKLDVAIGSSGTERWLLTYADMITLLLIVFILLFALSTIQPQKFEQLHQAILNGIGSKVITQSANGETLLPRLEGLTSHPTPVNSVNPSTGAQGTSNGQQSGGASSPATANQTPGQFASQVLQALTARGLQSFATITVSERGVVVTVLADQVFYATDSADPGPQGNQIIDTVGSVLTSLPNQVVIEGYTDNQPIVGGPYRSNDELSAMRAVDVELRLVNADGIPQARLSEEGYGDNLPVSTNLTPQGRAANRRIDFVILDPAQAPG